MLWILQSNLYRERGYDRMVSDLQRRGSNYITVKPIPFTTRLVDESFDTSKSSVDISELPEPEIDISKPIMVMGSYSLAKTAQSRGWKPGAFLRNLSYDVWSQAWASNLLLNPKAIICKMADAEPKAEKIFVRPVEDSKSFAGKVFSREEFVDWRDTIVKMTDADILNKDTEIIISTPVKIYNETRCFVVNGKIVTASKYKVGNTVMMSDDVDPLVIEFATECIKAWQPDAAFVIDIADTPKGYKIVEVNNFNSSGFYACDTAKIIDAVENFVGG